jgi:aspartate dehydrogenase
VRRDTPHNVNASIYFHLSDLIEQAPELIVEAASPDAVTAYAESILTQGISLVLASSSALVDSAFRHRVEDACRRGGSHLYIPAGALAGMDALYALAGHLERVTIDVVEPGEERMVFKGSAIQAIAKFPSRLNVAAAAVLAADHPVEVQLRQGQQRQIELTATGVAGDFSVRIHPTPLGVALSLLAAASVKATRRCMASSASPSWSVASYSARSAIDCVQTPTCQRLWTTSRTRLPGAPPTSPTAAPT